MNSAGQQETAEFFNSMDAMGISIATSELPLR